MADVVADHHGVSDFGDDGSEAYFWLVLCFLFSIVHFFFLYSTFFFIIRNPFSKSKNPKRNIKKVLYILPK